MAFTVQASLTVGGRGWGVKCGGRRAIFLLTLGKGNWLEL
jgi:hypothetical protein